MTDRELFPAHPASSPLPALHGVLPDVADACLASDHRGITLVRSRLHQAPRPASGTGFHPGLRPTLKLFSRSWAPRSGKRFHPFPPMAPLLTFRLFRVSHPAALGLRPPPCAVRDRHRVLLHPGWPLRHAETWLGAPPLM